MSTPIHASAVAIGGRGVLILGPSGSGKSDLALRLIDRGAILISDDYTVLTVSGSGLRARPPDNIAGKIEVRGIGITPVAFTVNIEVALAVTLVPSVERMPHPACWTHEGVTVPLVSIAPFEGSAPIKVELALKHGIAP
ncbi:HPr kinase/phosphorylase [Sphingomonas sp. ID0503]|uniref:HPr kinase/phosphorylase n=1 Tax=Sphingomonas sp. ID0503 TaxID=3399691 RepID=UPI003AFA416B